MKHPEKDQKVALPTREFIVGAQISNVLNVLQALNPFLLSGAPVGDYEGVVPRGAKMEGEAALAASQTFIHACACLDSMLSDVARWNLTAHDALYKSVEAVNKAQQTFLEAQTVAAQTVTRPSFNLRPKLVMGVDEFVAYWGDPLTPGAAIIGHGKTPEEALKDFDSAFQRAPDQQVVNIAAEQGLEMAPRQEPPAEPVVKPNRRKKKQ